MAVVFSINRKEISYDWGVSRYAADNDINNISSKVNYEFLEVNDVCSIVSGKYISSYKSEGIPYVRVANIRKLIMTNLTEDLVYISSENKNNILTKTNDVIISRTGTLGKAVLITDNIQGYAISQHVTILRLANNKILPGILCLYLNSHVGKKQLIGKGIGSTRLELTHESIKSIKLPLLDFGIQMRFNERLIQLISNYYSTIKLLDKLKEKTNTILGLNNYKNENNLYFTINKQSLDWSWSPNVNNPNRNEVLKKFRERYIVITLDKISKIKRGKGTRTEDYCEEGIPFLRTSSLINNSIDPFPDHYATNKTYNKFKQPIKSGNILYSIEGKIGEIALLHNKLQVVFKNHIQMIDIDKVIDGYEYEEICGWVYLVLSSELGKILCEKYTIVQATIPGLSSRLKEFIIPVDSKDKQFIDEFKSLGKQAYYNHMKLIDTIIELHDIQKEFNRILEV